MKGRPGKRQKGNPSGAMAKTIGSDLPIRKVAGKIADAVAENSGIVLVGETGSGKSTQLPQILADSRRFRIFPGSSICVTQPRRVAAVTIARRVASER